MCIRDSSCGKLGEQEFRKAVAKLLEQLKNDYQKYQHGKANPHGKMTVKQLAAKDKGLQSIEVTDQNIGSFNRIARKYGIDFAPFKVKGEKRYMVFFKAPDADAMTAAFKEYTATQVRLSLIHILALPVFQNFPDQPRRSALQWTGGTGYSACFPVS